MNKEKEHTATLLEIKAEDIDDASVFLNAHMNARFSAGVWAKALQSQWLADSPNSGFMLKDAQGKIVGLLCAIYSQQEIHEGKKKICNLHSWVVLPDYRTKSILLVLAAIRQKGFHFTMFTPNQSGLEIFTYLKFKPLNSTVTPLPHIPRFQRRGKSCVVSGGEYNVEALSVRDRQIYKDHANFSWLDRMLFKSGDRWGFILYRKTKYKKLPSARILFISDRALFFDCWSDIRTSLLFQHKLFTSIIESRFIGRDSVLSLPAYPSQRTFYLSENLEPLDIECIYSEIMVLDL